MTETWIKDDNGNKVSMARIIIADIERVILDLNNSLGYPTESYNKGVSQEKNYYLCEDYGGYALHQVSTGGGSTTIFRLTTKRELFDQIAAYASGIGIAKSSTNI